MIKNEKILVKDLFSIKKGKKAEETSSGERYIQIADLRNDNNVKHTVSNSKSVKCDKNDILIAWDGANAGTVGYNLEGVLGSTLAKLTPKKDYEINSVYCGRFLQSKFNYLQENCTGATIPHISRSVLEQIKIPLPPLSEQKRIADLLDTADKLRRQTQKIVEKYDELSQSLFLEMFGNPVSNPKGWEKRKIDDIFITQSGGTPSKKKKEYWENGQISWIGSNMCKNDIIVQTDGKYITKLGIEKSSAKIFPVNTVIVALVGATIGKVGLLKTPTATNQNVAGLIIKDMQTVNEFFSFYMMRNLFYKFMEIGNSKFKMANLSFIRNLDFFCPPIELQNKFAKRIELIEQQKAQAEQALQKSEELFNALLQKSFKF